MSRGSVWWREPAPIDLPPAPRRLAHGEHCGVPGCRSQGVRIQNEWGVCTACRGQPAAREPRIDTEWDRMNEQDLDNQHREDHQP